MVRLRIIEGFLKDDRKEYSKEYSKGLCNMKSFRDSGEIEIKPLTIFVGRNSCGKSSQARFG